jgi:UDP-glucose 4-epimerase
LTHFVFVLFLFSGVHKYLRWKMTQQCVLVTGGAGFVGLRLCRRLLEEGHRVISLDNYFAGSKEDGIPGVDYREGHTKDIEKLVPERPDLLYHLGEYSRVEKSLGEPSVVWDLNMVGTFGVVEYWRKRACKLVYAGSSTKFADGGLGRDQSPYAMSKAHNTDLVRNYGQWYQLPYAITYFYNVYGPGERAGLYGTVIEIFRQQYMQGKALTVVSPGTQKRNFTHVDDIVEGLSIVGAHGEGDEYGLGASESYSVLEVARMFGDNIQMLPERPGNRMDSVLDVTKAKSIGWRSTRSLTDYIAAIKKKAVAA